MFILIHTNFSNKFIGMNLQERLTDVVFLQPDSQGKCAQTDSVSGLEPQVNTEGQVSSSVNHILK